MRRKINLIINGNDAERNECEAGGQAVALHVDKCRNRLIGKKIEKNVPMVLPLGEMAIKKIKGK